MPKPSLPNRPTTDVDVIGQAWLNSLMDCVAWAMDYPRPDGRTIFGGPSGTISARVTAAGADPAPAQQVLYDSYFAIRLVDPDASTKIASLVQASSKTKKAYQFAVVFGATYDPTKQTISEESVCRVNNSYFYVPAYLSEDKYAENTQIAIKYTAPVIDDKGNETDPQKVEIVTFGPLMRVPNDNAKACYYILGSLIFNEQRKDGEVLYSVRVAQAHCTGTPQILWFSTCY